MVASGGQHFFLHEPVQLSDKNIVIPQFFFKYKGQLMARVARAKVMAGGQIEFPRVCKFTDIRLDTIHVSSTFWRIFADIEVTSSVRLKDVCGTTMHCKFK